MQLAKKTVSLLRSLMCLDRRSGKHSVSSELICALLSLTVLLLHHCSWYNLVPVDVVLLLLHRALLVIKDLNVIFLKAVRSPHSTVGNLVELLVIHHIRRLSSLKALWIRLAEVVWQVIQQVEGWSYGIVVNSSLRFDFKLWRFLLVT